MSDLLAGVNPTRLFVLSALAKGGAMYGHQIRRDARVDRAELWSDVRPGSLYGALHRLEGEGLVRALRTEQEGRLPARTVYEITDEGRRELAVLQAEAFEEVRFPPDPIDLALATASDMDEATLRGHLEDRVRDLTARLSRLDHLADRRWPDQTPADDLVLEHARLRLRAELEWHGLVLDQVGKLVPPAGSPPHISTAQQPGERIGEPPEYVRYEGRLAGTPSGNLDPPVSASDSRRRTPGAVQ